MDEFITIEFSGELPLVAAALHNGHRLSEPLLVLSALEDAHRLREEDPFTGIWTEISGNRIVAHHSRFEFDLNRPPEKAVYLEPQDAWGLQVWKQRPSGRILAEIRRTYNRIYDSFYDGFTGLVGKHGKLVVYDLHSYNFRRGGPDAPPEDSRMNPEINIGTGTMNREYWANVADRFISDLRVFDFLGRNLDVRENIRFKGGHFPRWIHENFAGSICCISVEIKKFFMDEWTGSPDHSLVNAVGDAIRSTVPGILEELSFRR